MNNSLVAFSFLFCCLLHGTLIGQNIRYQISGVVPQGSSWHNHVDDGETFAAEFIVDLSVLDSANDNHETGWYQRAVINGKVCFSGGYSVSEGFEGFDVSVWDGRNGYDRVAIRSSEGIDAFFSVRTAVPSALNSNILPTIGTEFQSFADGLDLAFLFVDLDGLVTFRWDTVLEAPLTFKALPIIGDLNCDGFVNLLDVFPLVDAIIDGTYLLKADINQDGAVNLQDVDGFLEILTG